MEKNLKTNRYRPDIEGLRGIAIAMVILFHLNKNWLPGGFTGVDIFFVMSGYVVTSSIIGHQSKSVLDYFLGFYARRFKRIFPALIACIVCTMILTIVIIPTSEAVKFIRPAIWSLLGWNNNFLIGNSVDYFNADQSLNPFLHTWALGVEVQYYFIFPILMLMVYGLKRPIKEKHGFKNWLLIIPTVISIIASIWFSFTNPTWAYYSLPSRFWEIIAGALLFISIAQGRDIKINFSSWGEKIFQLIVVLLIVIPLFAVNDKSPFPLPWALPSVLGTLMFIANGATQKNFIYRFLSSKPFVYIGGLSYSLYLWHWPIFTLFNWTFGLNSPLNMASALLITSAFSLASYYWIEKPVREFKNPEINDWKTIFIALGVITLIGLVMFAGLRNQTALEKFSIRKFPKDTQAYEKGDWKDPNSSLIPGYPQITSGNCMSPEGSYYSLEKVNLSLCATQKNSPTAQTIFLIGDSHAAHLFPMFHQILKQNNQIELLTTWRWNCIVSDSLDIVSGNNRAYCKEFTNGEIIKASKLLKAGDVVLISTSLNLQMTGLKNSLQEDVSRTNNMILNGVKIDQSTKLKEYNNSLKRITNQFSAIGVRTILWVDTPEMKINPLACSDLFSFEIPKANCSPEKQVFEEKQKIILEIFNDVRNSSRDVYIFNPNDILVPQGEFEFIDDNGLFLMEDENHISQLAARKLATPFYQFLQKNNLILNGN